MMVFNEVGRSGRRCRGWNDRGLPVPGRQWNNRVYLRQLVGLYFDVVVPGSRSLTLNGSGAITLNWGRGSAYLVKFEVAEKSFTVVYPDVGRFDLLLRGDVHLLRVFDNRGDVSLRGEIRSFRNLLALEVLRMPGSGLLGDVVALELLVGLRVLDLSGTVVSGDVAFLPASLEEVDLSGSLVWGDFGSMASIGGLRVVRLVDMGLSTAAVDGLLLALAARSVVNGVLDVRGVNGVRSNVSNAAVAVLVSRGWTLWYNSGVAFDAVGVGFDDGVVAFDG